MSVVNGQVANQNTFNNAFVSKQADSTMLGVLDLNNPGSGAQVSNVQQAINDGIAETALKIPLSEKGAPNGVAELDALGKVPAAQLPSYVDDVEEYANLAAFPVSGETGKIYVDLATARIYRWSGSIYIEISPSDVTSVFGRVGDVVAVDGDYDASLITYTPTGGLTADHVDSAIDELEANKLDSADFQSEFDTAFAGKDTDDLSEGITNLYFTTARARTAVVDDAIVDGVIDKAPSQNAVFDQLALKQNAADFNADFDARLATKDTDDLTEGSNLYYTQARFDAAFAAKDTDDLSEGAVNFYYTQARFDADFAAKDTDALAEGVLNLYYTQARFDADFAAKDTDDLAEGLTNLYFTDGRAQTAVVIDSIADGDATHAPSRNATFDALALKEDLANKSTNVALGTSNTLYPTQNAVKTYVDNSIAGSGSQSGIQFRDEASALGSSGTVNELDFVGDTLTASRTLNKVTVTVVDNSIVNALIFG